MKALKILVPLLVLGVGVVVAVILVATGPEVAKEEIERKPPTVEVIEVHRQDVLLQVRSQGTVEPRTFTVLSAEVAGKITHVSKKFQPGEFFEEGDVLLRIDPRDYRAAAAKARADLMRANVALSREEARAEVAREEYAEIGSGEPEPLALREPQLKEARAAVESAAGALTKAQADLSRTKVKAPYDGRVVRKRAELGHYVAPGTPLAEIFATDVAEVRLPVERRHLSRLPVELPVEPGQQLDIPVILEADVGGEPLVVTATVVRAGARIDPESRMLDLFAQIRDPFERRGEDEHRPLVMGLYVEARIRGRAAEDVFVLPPDALRERDQVYVERDGRLVFVTVEVLERTAERAVVRGLTDPSRVVISPLSTPVDGMEVLTTDAEREREVAREEVRR